MPSRVRFSAAVCAALSLTAAVPGAAGARNQFDPAVVRALCASAYDLGSYRGAPHPGHAWSLQGYDAGSGTSLVGAYPGFAPAEPGPELVVRVRVRQAGWSVFAREDTGAADADVFVLRGSCRRGTMQLRAADADEARVNDAPKGEYLLVTDFRQDPHGPAHVISGFEYPPR